MILVICTHAWFAVHFLDLRAQSPALFRLHVAVVAIFAGAFAVLPREVATSLSPGLAGLYMAIALAAMVDGLRRQARHVRLYALGTSSYLFFTIALFGLGVSGHNPWPRLDFFVLPKIGYLVETTAFCAALVLRVHEIQAAQAQARLQRLRDTQALFEAEAARLAANARAERSTLILAGASHDLSQPLGSLRLAIDALRQSSDLPQLGSHLDRAVDYAQTLLRDLLRQARSQSLQDEDRVALGELFEVVAGEHRAAARAKGVVLRVVDSRYEVLASPLLLTRILHNLVSNAVRYTARGRVVIGLRRLGADVELQVHDTGPGLLPRQVALFQRPFRQGDDGVAEGHGLGLFIVRSLCDQCGYGFRVISHRGRGSAFCVRIPASS